MEKSRNECVCCVQQNVKEIKEYIKDIPDDKIDALFEELKDILYFYGFKRSQVEKYFEYPQWNYNEFPDNKLLKFEGITNAILYNLKYKM